MQYRKDGECCIMAKTAGEKSTEHFGENITKHKTRCEFCVCIGCMFVCARASMRPCVCLCACVHVCLAVCLSDRFFIYLSRCLCMCLH